MGSPLATAARDERMLEAAGGFDDDTLEAIAREAADQCCDGLLVVGDAEQKVSFEQIDVELRLADIDADVDRGTLFCHGYSVLLNSGS